MRQKNSGNSTDKKSQLRPPLFVIGIATFVTFAIVIQYYLTYPDPDFPLWPIFITELVAWYLWAAFFPFIFRLVERYPLMRPGWPKALLAQFFAGGLFAVLHVTLQHFAVGFLLSTTSFGFGIDHMVFLRLVWRFFVYLALVVICNALVYQKRYSEEQLKTSRLSAGLKRNMLERLRSQLDSTFLFGVLKSLRRMMKQDTADADEFIDVLGRFLRKSVDSRDDDFTTLAEETNLITGYVEVQRIRYHRSLNLDLHLNAPANTRVTSRLMFALIQNAIEDAVAIGDVNMTIRAEKQDSMLRLRAQFCFDIAEAAAVSRAQLERFSATHPVGMEEFDSLKFEVVLDLPFEDAYPLSLKNRPAERSREIPGLGEYRKTIRLRERALSEDAPMLDQRWARWALIILAYSLIATYSLLWAIMDASRPLPWHTIATILACWMLWIPFTPVIVYFARRFPVADYRWLRHSVLHVAMNSLLCFAIAIALTVLNVIAGPAQAGWAALKEYMALVGFEVLPYWTVISASYARDYYRKWSAGELQSLKLQSQLIEARLEAMKMQLHPHFLFNTLHSLSQLMYEDLDAAEQMLTRIENFFRFTLSSSDAPEIQLREELNFLQSYLSIQQIRFQNRLQVRMKVQKATLNHYVPNMILQPLVENAIRHGISRITSGGVLEVTSRRVNGKLRLEVRDNGPGVAGRSIRPGFGLISTRKRLKQLYGEGYQFRIRSEERGGMRIRLEIPASQATA